jgi:hypothetical protein
VLYSFRIVVNYCERNLFKTVAVSITSVFARGK